MQEFRDKLAGRRILVVEDMQTIAMDIKYILTDIGCEVIGPAPNVKQALALIAKESIDGAVMDINLGDEQIFPVAHKLQELDRPFLFLTGYNNQSLLPVEFQDVSHVNKPFLETVLLEQVVKLFE